MEGGLGCGLTSPARDSNPKSIPAHMFRSKSDKEKKRFYLLPGQGGRAYHRKQMLILKSALIVGLLVSATFALIMYFIYRNPK